MCASGLMPRSPVWLRKIPSTVSGSQGSRLGFPPAVRFAFPLGARLNITLRARPCQELFSESFCRPTRGPRGAFALRASALRGDEFGIIRAPGAPRPGNPPAHRMPTTPARWSGCGSRRARTNKWYPPGVLFCLALRTNRSGSPALAHLGPPGRSARRPLFGRLYIGKAIGDHLQARALLAEMRPSAHPPAQRSDSPTPLPEMNPSERRGRPSLMPARLMRGPSLLATFLADSSRQDVPTYLYIDVIRCNRYSDIQALSPPFRSSAPKHS